eukprot:356171-Hanusia_phi.AAC.2
MKQKLEEEMSALLSACLLALCRNCSRLMDSGDLVPQGAGQDKKAGNDDEQEKEDEDEGAGGKQKDEGKSAREVFHTWIRGVYRRLVRRILACTSHHLSSLQALGKRAGKGLVAREAETATRNGLPPHAFTEGLFHMMIGSMISNESLDYDVVEKFEENYLEKFGHVRCYTWRAMSSFVRRRVLKTNILDFLNLYKVPEAKNKETTVSLPNMVGDGADRAKKDADVLNKRKRAQASRLDFAHFPTHNPHNPYRTVGSQAARAALAAFNALQMQQMGRVLASGIAPVHAVSDLEARLPRGSRYHPTCGSCTTACSSATG